MENATRCTTIYPFHIFIYLREPSLPWITKCGRTKLKYICRKIASNSLIKKNTFSIGHSIISDSW